MSKGKETMAAEIAANIKKKGFILYKKDLNLCCAHFDDTAIGRIMRHINEYVKNPSYTPQKIEFAEQLQYDLFVDGIRENTEEWRDKIVQRRLRYEESKKNNSDNSDKTNNSDNCDKTDNSDKTKKTGIDKKNTSEDNTVQSSQVQSSQATSNDVSSTQINSNSKKEYQTSFFHLFSKKEYTANYLKEKKIYFKNAEAWENFFNYNNDTCHWALKPETAARRWFKNNPEDKGEAPKEEKTAPQPPTTPARLTEARDKILDAIRDQVPFTDFKSWFQPLQLVNIITTTEGDNITLGTKSKFHAELFAKDYQDIFRQTYFALTSRKVNALECVFIDANEIFSMQILTAFESAALRKAAAEAKAAEAKALEEASKKRQAAREKSLANIRANLNPGPNVYAWNSNQDEFSRDIYFEPFKDTPQKLTTETTTPPELKTLHAEILEQCKQNVTKQTYNLYYETIDLLAVDYYNTDKIDGTRYAELTIGVISQNFIDMFRKDFEKNYATAFKIIKAYEPHIFYKIITPEK